jgi:hypothetical protein
MRASSITPVRLGDHDKYLVRRGIYTVARKRADDQDIITLEMTIIGIEVRRKETVDRYKGDSAASQVHGSPCLVWALRCPLPVLYKTGDRTSLFHSACA